MSCQVIFSFLDRIPESLIELSEGLTQFYQRFRRNYLIWPIFQELMTPKVKSAPDPSVSTVVVIHKFSKRTFNREKALKSFLKSDKNSRFYSTFNLLRNKKNRTYVWNICLSCEVNSN